MKKNYLLMLLSSVLLLTGCRTESFNQEDSQIQERSNSILKVSLQEVLSETSRYDKELSHDISTFTWDKRSENKDSEKKSEDNNYYFNTEDIQKITADNATYYTIPAVSKTDEREDILHSLSLRVSDDGLQSRMIKVQLKDDENIEIVSSVPYTLDPQSVLAREDAECTTYLVSGPCSCHSVHEAGGCTHPIQVMITQCSSGTGTNSSGSTYYTGTPSATFPGSSSGAYVYSTADQVYNSLRLKLKPNYILTDIQKFKILELPNLASQIVTFLNQNPEHKAAAISFINSIGPISTAQEMQTAISNYINTFNFNAGLSSAQNIWKTQNPALFDKVLAYILQDYPNRKNFGYWGINFLIQNPTTTWEQFQPMLTFAHNFLQENPDTINPELIFQRLKDLDYVLTQNPNLLLDIPCNELDDWKALANHPIPISIKNRLFQINGLTHWYQDGFEIQNLDIASGPGINMDLFPIRITTMPYKPGTNQRYTHAEFFDFFRRNVNQFAETFTPLVNSSYGIDDTALWFSNNPLGALVHIEIPGDNGTVVCSGYNAQAWVFTTIKAPIKLDGLHPVSGNRIFGYSVDSNGFMYLYTRGVDRFTKSVGNATLTYLAENFAFSKADELWKGMQTKLENYINSPQNGGLANKIEAKTYRPAYSKIKNYLKNKAPLSSLGCN